MEDCFAPSPPLNSVPFIFSRINSYSQGRLFLPVAFISIIYNENKTSTSLETLQRFENEAFLKSPLRTNLG